MNRLELPNGFTYDDKFYKIVFLNEMTGVQQNKLANTKYKSMIDHVEPIFIDLIEKVEDESGGKCTASNDMIVKQLIEVADLEFLLVKLKEITFGEIHIQEKIECTHCKHKQDARIELDKLEIINPEEERPDVIQLPKSGQEVQFKPLCYADLKKYASNPERLINSATTSAASMRIRRLGDNYKVAEKDLETLPAKDLAEIKNKAPESKKIDLDFEHNCSKCKEDFNFVLEVLAPDFLTQ